MNHEFEPKLVTIFKNRLNIWAFICFTWALSCVQISYIFNGVGFLDFGIFFLIPAFLFFIAATLQESISESKDYCIGLVLLACAVGVALVFKYKFEVGANDDTYHTVKVIAYSFKNSFFTKFNIAGFSNPGRALIDFIEDIWGLAWRYTHWDYVIVLTQILPVFILWKQLVEFFRNRKVDGSCGFFSTIIILSMQFIWAQASSTYVDSLAGIIAAITLLRIADILGGFQSRNLYSITITAYLSVLCLLLKPSLIPLSLFCLGVSLWVALKSLNKKEIFIVVLSLIPSLGFFLKHCLGVWIKFGTPFYPLMGGGAPGFRTTLPAGYYAGKYFLNFKFLYVLSGWLNEYKIGYVSPDPCNGVGIGFLWTFLVVPILALALIVRIIRVRQIRGFNPSVLILIFLLSFYYFIDGSVVGRYMIGFSIFIMAWALAWMMQNIESRKWVIPSWGKMMAAFIMLTAALLSFSQAVKGTSYLYRLISVLNAESHAFPKYIDPLSFQEKYCSMILDVYKNRPLSNGESYLIQKCQEHYYIPESFKETKIKTQDYHFNDIIQNYDKFRFTYQYVFLLDLANIPSLKGTILDPDNKNGVWAQVSPIAVCLKPNTDLKEDAVRKIAKDDFDQVWSLLKNAGNEG